MQLHICLRMARMPSINGKKMLYRLRLPPQSLMADQPGDHAIFLALGFMGECPHRDHSTISVVSSQETEDKLCFCQPYAIVYKQRRKPVQEPFQSVLSWMNKEGDCNSAFSLYKAVHHHPSACPQGPGIEA